MNGEIVRHQSGEMTQEIVSWELLVQRFIESLDAKPATILLYRKGLSYFIKWLEGAQPTRGNILAYKKALEDRKLASFTINAYLTAVRQFFAWLEAEGLYLNVAKAVKGLKQNDQSKDALTGVQCRRLLDSISLNGSLSRRDYAMLNLMIRTGLRTIEVSRANIGDIRNEGAEKVLWVHGKGRDEKDKFVVLTPETHNPILDYLCTRNILNSDDPLFMSHSNRGRGKPLTTRTIRQVVGFYLRKAGLKTDRTSAHSLRHTFVTLAIENGATLAQVQASARHVSPQTTMRYFHNRDRLVNAAEKVIRF
jgi:integrase/recombinase XerC/integrase/recombinase XerD